MELPYRRNRKEEDNEIGNDVKCPDGDKRALSVSACTGDRYIVRRPEWAADEEHLDNIRAAPQENHTHDDFSRHAQARVDEDTEVEKHDGHFNHQERHGEDQLVGNQNLKDVSTRVT
jgi:hypothetical protein